MKAAVPGTKEAAGGRGARGLIDPQSLMSIRSLELRARVVVEGFWNGLHRSPYHGFSVEFTEYRQYVPGDDPRYLDWRLFARSDRYYIKKFEDETNLRCYFVVDASRSMGFGSIGFSKAEYARTLAATLAYFLHMQGDAVGLLSFDERVRDYLPARNRRGHLRHLLQVLEKPGTGASTDLAQPCRRLLDVVRKRGLMVFISDLLAPTEAFERNLVSLAACGHEAVVFHLLDPAELNFGFEKAALFEDLESGRELYIDPALVRRDYVKRLEQHNRAVELSCQKAGVGYLRVSTDRPLEGVLFDFLRERESGRGKRVKRTGGSRG